jgi:hypothetical protein
LNRLSPLSAATDVIDRETLPRAGEIIANNLSADPRRDERLAMSHYYFGMAKGQSTTQLLEFLNATMIERDTLVGSLDPTRSPDPAGDEIDRTTDEKAGGEGPEAAE